MSSRRIRQVGAWLRTLPGAGRFVSGILLLGLIISSPAIYGWLTSGSRLSPDLSGAEGRVNLAIELPFDPQAFHQKKLSDFGTFAGFEGDRTVRLLNVTPDNLEQLKHIYWIVKISPAAKRSGY